MENLVREQWTHLRSWLDRVDISRYYDDPSGLPGWTIRDLVVHLGFGIVMVDEVSAAPPGAEPIGIEVYIARYRPAAHVIAAATRELAASLPDPLDGIDELAERAWNALKKPLPPVVMGRRGPLTLEDFLSTRLLELVVHADDLQRALPTLADTPVLHAALPRVADLLTDAYTVRAGASPAHVNDIHWIRTATGRNPSDDPHLPLL